jgi:hypothetical protein
VRSIPAARTWLLRLYPMAWRSRYGEEFAALLDDYPLTPFALLDVCLGALDAHIAPQDATGRILRALHQPRRSAITVFCAYIAFVIAGLSYNQMIEDDLPALDTSHPAIAAAYHVILYGSAVALLAVLAGGLPIALAVARRALVVRRKDILLLFAVPPLSLAVWLMWGWINLNVIAPSNGHHAVPAVHHPPSNLLFVSWFAAFGLAALASTAAVSIAVSRCEVAPRLFRRALAPAALATLLMLIMLSGAVAWGLFVRAEMPDYLERTAGPLGETVYVAWLSQVAVMALATLIATFALLRAYRTRGDEPAAEEPEVRPVRYDGVGAAPQPQGRG